MAEHRYTCPICRSSNLTLRYEASYIYSYIIDDNAPGLSNSEEFLSFQYDKREQKDNRSFIECNQCKSQYPSTFLQDVLKADKSNDYVI